MSRGLGFKTKLLASSLAGFIAVMAAYSILAHFNPWHSGLLNLVSLGALIAIAGLGVIIINFSSVQIKGFIKREKLSFIAVAFCVAFFAVGAASITQSLHFSKTSGEAITYDEGALLPVGYYYLENGQYFLSPEHPPLVKLISAVPFYFLHVTQPKPALPKNILLKPYAQFYWGKTFLFESGNKTEKIISGARLSVLAVNTAIVFLLYLTLAYLWSRRTGLISVVFITTSQFLIGHASLSTLDFMSGMLTILALCWLAGWLKAFAHKNPAKLNLAFAGIFLGLALLAKFSTLLLLPMVVIIGSLYLVINWPALKVRKLKFIGSIVAIFCLALALILICYAPLVRHMSSADLSSQLSISYDTSRLPKTGLNLLKHVAGYGIFGRAFAEYSNGVLLVNNRIYQGAGAVYFRDHFYGAEGAGSSYFPLLYLAKLQITYHLLSLVALLGGVWFIAKERWAGVKRRLIANPLAITVLLYCLVFGGVATLSTLQIGLRHLMPVIPGFMVLTAIGLDYLIKNLKLNRAVLILTAAIVAICLVGSAARSYPYYLSYYNAAAGGTSNGYKFAVDSNYDWGQDLKRLAKWEQDNRITNLRFDLFVDPYLPTSYYLGYGAQTYSIETDAPLPAGSYLAVSANQYEINTHKMLSASKKYNQFDKDLVARVGTTIFIYKMPAR